MPLWWTDEVWAALQLPKIDNRFHSYDMKHWSYRRCTASCNWSMRNVHATPLQQAYRNEPSPETRVPLAEPNDPRRVLPVRPRKEAASAAYKARVAALRAQGTTITGEAEEEQRPTRRPIRPSTTMRHQTSTPDRGVRRRLQFGTASSGLGLFPLSPTKDTASRPSSPKKHKSMHNLISVEGLSLPR